MGYYPNIIKIDVEGFELEVLKGIQTVLSSSTLKAVFIEVHFKLLEENGYTNAIEMIVKILHKYGFSTTWIDFLHIVGFKSVIK
ncbi:MAG: FkbM family methyltransferase [Moorea sp. SIO3I7]|nr:FkbM family methyltransferase [Moorena sp. SIO3I7]NEO08580.1 FkbM family methyltransferase [Moorena sp. SIO3I8]NEP22358.1 FkbM family methyltransferase [Moorena sp. SIO3I6]NEQ58154.1 FkbM family methyltransferase [Moorena sp. SIO4A1]